ncbi:membrane-bound lytic murein transglycosylase D [Neolewinella xylanilytica]|uniref:Membrane-bound lytic murein transglycosylase D n=1 Tax=Neolewinella xylanilytica TaxID=1514080 RepID=A0A2S6I1V8_9BACT|nr:lytic transglycosylase domain-containing protein [Neolewinella xylanilytica]PPK85162.1 membrane-bound lytic murein transglycosylase D [Neolewinella xylanilytica]
MKFVYLLFLSSLLSLPLAAEAPLSQAEAERYARQIMELSREEVERRLKEFDGSLLEYQVDDAVFQRVVNYIRNWPISSGRVLGRSARFYPIFEEQLQAAGLPLELKHLSVVESALRSWAVSPVGAGGLWQLMPGTARELGLIVNGELDERLDPWLGCAAGLEYLRMQYERYDDWALALAAYNSGPGNVNRAIRRSGSRNYWTLRRYLPRETRHYVPNFIAAVFLMTYHNDYGLDATKLPLDEQVTERIIVDRKLSLYRVAQVTGLRPEVVIEMNPQYLRGYLPGLRGGHSLQLPSRVMPAMRTYLETHPASTPEHAIYLPWTHPLAGDGELDGDRHYVRREIPVWDGDSTALQLAQRHGLPVDRLVVWSDRGQADSLTVGELFTYYEVKTYQPYDTRIPKFTEPLATLVAPPIRSVRSRSVDLLAELPEAAFPEAPRKKWWQVLFSWVNPA